MKRGLLLLGIWLLLAAAQAARVPTLLRVVDARGLRGQAEQLTWLGSLQGTLNRQDGEAVVFLVRNQDDADWADTLTRMYQLRRERLTPPALLAVTRAELTGQVRYDPAQPWTRDIALTAAAYAPGQVIATADDLGLPTVLDLRNRWVDAEQAYSWAIDEYRPRAEASLLAITGPAPSPLADLIAARKLQAVDLSPFNPAETPLLGKWLTPLRTGGSVIGAPAGEASSEEIARALTQLHENRPLTYVPAMQTANLSCFARFPVSRPQLQSREELPPLETLHTLVLIYDSGATPGAGSQSLDYATGALKRLLDDDAMRELPVGVEVPAALLDYAPAVYQSLLARQRLRRVEFLAAPGSDPVRALAAGLDAAVIQGSNGEWPTVAALNVAAQAGWKGVINYPLNRDDVPEWMQRPELVPAGFPVLPGNRVRNLNELRALLPSLAKAELLPGLQGQLFVLYLDPVGFPPELLRLALPEITRNFSLMTPSQAFRGKIEYDAVGAYLRAKQQRGIAQPQRARPTLRVSAPVTTLAAPTAADPIPITVRIDGAAPVLAARLIYLACGRTYAADLAPAGNGRWTATLPPVLAGGEVVITARVVEQEGCGVSVSPPSVLTIPTVDADADGADDTLEAYLETDPHHPDTDGDGLPDGYDPHPTRPDRDLAALGLPIQPPNDGPLLLDAGKSTLDAGTRLVPAGSGISYRLDVRDLPTAPAFLHLVTEGTGTVAIDDGGPKEHLAKTMRHPIEQAVPGTTAITDVPLPAPLVGESVSVLLNAGDKPLRVYSLVLSGDPEGPYLPTVQLTPEFPPARLPIAVRVVAYDRAGITAVRLRYGPDPRHLTTLALTPQPDARNVVFTGMLPPQQNSGILVYSAEADDAAGHHAATPYAMTTVGLTDKHTVALRGTYDLRGDWEPSALRGAAELRGVWQPAAIWGRWGRRLDRMDGVADSHLFLARPGTYQVWILAQPLDGGIAVRVAREHQLDPADNVVKLSRPIPAGSPAGWYRVGAFSVPESIRLTVSVRPAGDHGTCAYGEVVLTQDEHFAPPLHQATIDWYNSVTVFGIEPDQQAHGKLPITVLATGNIDALDVQVTNTVDEADSRDAVHLARDRDGAYQLDTRGMPAGKYILRALGKRIILGNQVESGTLVETDVPFSVAAQ